MICQNKISKRIDKFYQNDNYLRCKINVHFTQIFQLNSDFISKTSLV